MIKIGKYFNSVEFVITGTLLFLGMLVLDSQSLYNSSFPSYMNDSAKVFASIFGAVATEIFLLMLCANNYLLEATFGKHLPKVFGMFGFISTLFFFEAFDSEVTWVVTSKRFFISIQFGFMNYILPEVFIKKWNELRQKLEAEDELKLKCEALYEEVHHLRKLADQQEYELDGYRSQDYEGLVTKYDQLVTEHQSLVTKHDRLVTKHDQLVTENKKLPELIAAVDFCNATHKRPKGKNKPKV